MRQTVRYIFYIIKFRFSHRSLIIFSILLKLKHFQMLLHNSTINVQFVYPKWDYIYVMNDAIILRSIICWPLLDLIHVIHVQIVELVLNIRRDVSPVFLWKAAKWKECESAREEEAAGRGRGRIQEEKRRKKKFLMKVTSCHALWGWQGRVAAELPSSSHRRWASWKRIKVSETGSGAEV